MVKYYAQIDEQQLCIGVSQLSGEVVADDMVELDSYDISVLGKLWQGGKWVDNPHPPQPEPSKEPTNADIMQKLNDMSGDQVSAASLDAAYVDGVNAV